MGDHDVIEEQDGWVRCRCGRTFSDNTTIEAYARQRRHFAEERRKTDDVAAEGLATAREAWRQAQRGTDGS